MALLAGAGLAVSLALRARSEADPAEFARLAATVGVTLWGVWVVLAAVADWDGGWRFPLQPWVLRPGFWRAYSVSVVLAPTGIPVLTAFLVSLVALTMARATSPAQIPVTAVALGLFLFCTLRVTSIVRTLTLAGPRACGIGIATLLVAWDFTAHGVAPMRWLAAASGASASGALGSVGALSGLLAVLCFIDGLNCRRALLAGKSTPGHATLGIMLLKRGANVGPVLSRMGLLGWVRQANFWFSTAFALVFPVWGLLRPGRLQSGMPIAFVGFAVLFVSFTRGNLLGCDGPSVLRFETSGVPPWRVLVARGAMLDVIEVTMLVPTVLLAAMERPYGSWTALPLLAFIAATVFLRDAAGLVVSWILPERIERSAFRSGTNAAGGNWIMVGTMFWTIVCLVTFLHAPPGSRSWLWSVIVLAPSVVARLLAGRILRRRAASWSDHALRRLGALEA